MPIFLMISRHTAESCPMNNEKAKKIAIDVASKLGPLTKKHRIKVVENWSAHPEHLMVQVKRPVLRLSKNSR
jgi:hypothetical protein